MGVVTWGVHLALLAPFPLTLLNTTLSVFFLEKENHNNCQSKIKVGATHW